MDLLSNSWDDIQKFFGIGGQTTANTDGMNPQQAGIASGAAAMGNAGLLTSIFGGITSAVGSFYAAKSQQYQLQSQASSLQFQAGMDSINAHGAEMSAQSIMQSRDLQTQQYTMRAGQEQAAETTATAGRGIDLSSASAVDQRASNDLVKQIDTNTINSNAVRAAWAQRTQATNDSNQALLAGASAQNMRASAVSISPGAAMMTSLLGSASSIASRWQYQRPLQIAGYGSGPSWPSQNQFMPQGGEDE